MNNPPIPASPEQNCRPAPRLAALGGQAADTAGIRDAIIILYL